MEDGKLEASTFSRTWNVSGGSPSNLQASGTFEEKALVVVLTCDCVSPLLLHWGFVESKYSEWKKPDITKCAVNSSSQDSFVSKQWDDKAIQTFFKFKQEKQITVQHLVISIPYELLPFGLKFVLKEVNSNRWLKCSDGADFFLEIPLSPEVLEYRKCMDPSYNSVIPDIDELNAFEKALTGFRNGRDDRKKTGSLNFKSFVLNENHGELDVSVFVNEGELFIHVVFAGCLKSHCLLHWGTVDFLRNSRRSGSVQWACPNESLRPSGTIVVDPVRSCDTPLTRCNDENPFIQNLEILVPFSHAAQSTDNDLGLSPEIGGILFVLRDVTDVNKWFKNSDFSDFNVPLIKKNSQYCGNCDEMVDKILQAEIEWDHMTLMHRYSLMESFINDKQKELRTTSKITDSQHEFWDWIYVWSRFAYLGLLDWQRNYNTKPRDLAAATFSLTKKIAEMWERCPELRSKIRLVLSCISRGGGRGQAIRDRILDIMHKHHISEHAGNFFEEWHQKLHNNTTPDDVGICRAAIKFLETGGDKQQYWKTLANHGITSERLLSYERKISSEPYLVNCDRGALIRDLYEYLDILQDVHDALDLRQAFMHSRNYLATETASKLDYIVSRLNTDTTGLHLQRLESFQKSIAQKDTKEMHETFCLLSDIRMDLVNQLDHSNGNTTMITELLFLDFALEQQQGIIVMGSRNLSLPQYSTHLKQLIAVLARHDPTNEELKVIAEDWDRLSDKCSNYGFFNPLLSALMLKALTDRLCREIGTIVDEFQQKIGPKALFLGTQVGTYKKVIDSFVDCTLRGSALLSMTQTLKKMEPLLREAANLPPWQLISVVTPVQGELVSIDRLENIQGRVFECPTILLSNAVCGEEEIPTGVQAVLVRSAAVAPDILSHISVRARNAHVLLAVCFDSSVAEKLEKECVNKWVEIVVSKDASSLIVEPKPRPELGISFSRKLSGLFNRSTTQALLASERKTTVPAEMNLTTVSEYWSVSAKDFDREIVGGKSCNLKTLTCATDVATPISIALPYNTMQKCLFSVGNKQIILPKLRDVLKRLTPDVSNEDASSIFREANGIVQQLVFPEETIISLRDSTRESEHFHQGFSVAKSRDMLKLVNETEPEKMYGAIKSVWASLFGLRPWVSLSKAGKSYHELTMAVLVQQIIPTQYAFVLHTKNPFGSVYEMYGELVPGLGETIVGNYPGRALSWSATRKGAHKIVAFPSKSVKLETKDCLIFRSDSNGEDLEGFAGAGLFESVCTEAPTKSRVAYNSLKIIYDEQYRNDLLSKISNLAFSIEDVFGSPQDIEGVVDFQNQLVVVQTRPQV